MSDYYIGQRLSCEGALCTVRYVGKIEGTKGEWLGVEWDDDSRGKHGGQHQGKVYFKCLSKSATAASFLRPTRPYDSPRTFIEAVRHKYAPDSSLAGEQERRLETTQPVKFSGKVAEEIGFDLVWKQLSNLAGLKIILVDGLCVKGITLDSDQASKTQAQTELFKVCPNIQELDLSRNLLEDWNDVADICRPLENLRVLKVSGNRLRALSHQWHFQDGTPFQNVRELYLDATLMTWGEISQIVHADAFPNLKLVSASANQLESVPTALHAYHARIDSLVLDGNCITNLEDLQALFNAFPNTSQLSLEENRITHVWRSASLRELPLCRQMRTLNLRRNKIANWNFINDLTFAFPILTSLRLSGNPLYEIAEENAKAVVEIKALEDRLYMLTLARVGTLKTLNYSNITPQDRLNGELYYLSLIEDELKAAVLEGRPMATQDVRTRHPRYHELCQIYERDPLDAKQQAQADTTAIGLRRKTIPPGSLAARLVNFNFVMITAELGLSPRKVVLETELPRSLSTYSLKGLLSRKLGVRPLGIRLVYESAEMDPVADMRVGVHSLEDDDDDVEWDIDPSSTGPSPNVGNEYDSGQEGMKWKKREVEMVDSTRDIGSWVDDGATSATVRIEIPEDDLP